MLPVTAFIVVCVNLSPFKMSSFLKASLLYIVNTKQGNTYATYLKENYFQLILL